MRAATNSSSITSSTSKLHTRARIDEYGLNVAQPKGRCRESTTNTVPPGVGSPCTASIDPLMIHG
jgi:hypothetical protein